MADENDEIEFDLEAASKEISDGLFGPTEEDDDIEIEVETPSGEGEPVEEASLDQGQADPVSDIQNDDPVEPLDQPADDLSAAPRTWRKEAAAAWANVPDVVKQEIAKREADMFKGIEQYKQYSNIGSGFSQILNPYLPVLQRDGINPFQHVNDLLNVHYTLVTGTPEQKLGLLQNIAQQFGVPLDSLVPADEQSYVDPQVATLQARINQLESLQQQQLQQHFDQRRASVESEIQAFAADTATNPYFEAVAPTMSDLIQKGQAANLREAYDKAVWIVPEIREKMIASVTAKQQQQRAEHAQRARMATSANVRTTPKSVSGTAPLGSMDETIEAAFQEIKSRG